MVKFPLLAVLSPQFRDDPAAVARQLRDSGQTQLLRFMIQQIHQFRLQGEAFAMQHQGAEDEMERVWRGLLSAIPLEERLEGVTLADLLTVFTPEEFLRGLSEEQCQHLRTLLEEE